MEMWSNIEICFKKGRKHCGKGEKAGYQHFLFSQAVSLLSHMIVKSRDCLVTD